MFKIIVAGWQCENYINRCLDSIKCQNITDWRCAVVIDPSNDLTYEIAKTYENEKIIVHLNKIRKVIGYNQRQAIQMLEPDDEDILVFIDADDWFINDNSLKIVKSYYDKNPELLVTHGSYQTFPNNLLNNNGPYLEDEFKEGIRSLEIGSWKASHLKTMKFKVFKKIKETSFTNNEGTGLGTWLGAANDLSLMLSALEMAGYKKTKFIPEILYVYNRENNWNEDKTNRSLQEQCAEYIMTKSPKYTMVENWDEKKIDTLIFSKDRACQLDLLLRSINDNFSSLDNIWIIYKYSNDEFLKAYEKIIKKFNKINFVKENDFYIDVQKTIQNFNNEYFLTFVDDDVIIRKPNLNILKHLNKETSCISLRMANHIKHCYSQNTTIKIPTFTILEEEYIKWDWTKQPHFSDFGYPSCINSHIYTLDYFKILLNKISFVCPNTLEVAIDNNRNFNKPYMISYLKTMVLNIPNNVTQKLLSRNSNNNDYSLKRLNDIYLSGYVINTNNLYEFNNVSAHQEVDYNYIVEREVC